MPSLQQLLTTEMRRAFSSLGYPNHLGEVVISERKQFGQFQCNDALVAAGAAQKNPHQVAQEVVEWLNEHHHLPLEISIAGPGFINLTVADTYLAELATTMLQDQRIGCPVIEVPKKVVLDFGGPNIAKPMHVGHLRSTIIGDSLQRLNRFMGNEVISDIHLGDWGTQMGMVIRGIQKEQPNLVYFDEAYSGPYPEESPVTVEDLEKIYPRESALCKEDPAEKANALEATVKLQAGQPGLRALWKHLVAISLIALRNDFNQLGVSFTDWNGESFYNDRIPAMLDWLKKQGYAVESEGALVIFLQDIPPLILVKSDGAYLYATTDMAAIEERVRDQKANRLMYVVDKRQALHFEQVFQSARLTGLAPDTIELEFHGYGTMNGPDGRPFKTRAGGAMKLKDLIQLVQDKAAERMSELGVAHEYPKEEQAEIAQKVGIAALKFSDLINNKTSDYIFDLERFTSFEGKTGPYLVYSAVRIQSIFRKMEVEADNFKRIQKNTEKERDLLLILLQLPDVVQSAYLTSSPHVLADYIFRVSQEFNRFYQECNISQEKDNQLQESWLAVSHLCLRQIQLVTNLLGIEIPARM